jgi:DNA-binding GntR family transcriptional regulator
MSDTKAGRLPKPAPASAYERLKQAIITGELEPGAHLVETALARWCEVSRTPVREALTRLEQDGLVQHGPRGLVVRERSPEEILDIYETRIVLEATAARLAAQRATALDRVRLGHALGLADDVDADDPSALSRANRELHRVIWQSTHNESLIDLLERLDLHLVRFPETTLAFPGRWEEAIAQHREIVAAIAAGDSELASRLATEHFTAAREIRLRLWGQSSPGTRI